jgi:shikimate kinase
LRFADRVKQVKNQARVNYDPAQERLRELLAERNALQAECEALRLANSELNAKVRHACVCHTIIVGRLVQVHLSDAASLLT